MNSGCPRCADAATVRRRSHFSASAKRRSFPKSTRLRTKYPSAARLFMSAPGTEPFEHIHPPYHSEYKGHRLVVMTCPTAISENEYKNFNSYLENVVMKNNITGIFRHFQQTTTNFFVMLG